ncbi:MAG: dephospho-CoA kinase [Planctomycetota bacterium]|nr:dephospho-CoA kinase [Planctomycetota bacterium]
MNAPVIGIVGGVGSGKSTVTRWVAQYRSIFVIDADRIGHDVLKLDPVKTAVRQRFGDSVFDSNHEIQRPVLGRLIFGNTPTHETNRLDLETIVHPVIRQEITRQIQEARSSGKYAVIMLDAAVLLESGWHEVCDHFVFVDTPFEQRLRNIGNRGWSPTELERREAHQFSLEKKRSLCQFRIDNSHTIEDSGRQLLDILDQVSESH